MREGLSGGWEGVAHAAKRHPETMKMAGGPPWRSWSSAATNGESSEQLDVPRWGTRKS